MSLVSIDSISSFLKRSPAPEADRTQVSSGALAKTQEKTELKIDMELVGNAADGFARREPKVRAYTVQEERPA